MMTATLRNISANLVSGIIEKNKTKLVITLEYIAFLFCFILGSIIFYILFKYNSNRNNLLLIQLLPLIISFTLLITLIISIFVDKEKYSDKKIKYKSHNRNLLLNFFLFFSINKHRKKQNCCKAMTQNYRVHFGQPVANILGE